MYSIILFFHIRSGSTASTSCAMPIIINGDASQEAIWTSDHVLVNANVDLGFGFCFFFFTKSIR